MTAPKLLFLLFATVTVLLLCAGCGGVPNGKKGREAFRQDSLQAIALLERGDLLYARRDGMGTIAESLVYFDSAYRVAQRIKDTFLLAYSVYYMGNVYNAWNREPQTTLRYYKEAYSLFSQLPAQLVKAYQVRYIIAHAYDGEKAKDTAACVQTLRLALQDLEALPDSIRQQMIFLPDFAWVATNVGAYALADSFLSIVPRYRIVNDPLSNNYLDHYYLTRARMEVLGRKQLSSPYLDSLQLALAHCGNRFDSAYYSNNLSTLLEAADRPEAALRFARLSEELNRQVGQNDVLSVLRQQLSNEQVEAGKERESRIRSELERRNILLIGIVLLMLLLLLLWNFWQRRRKESAERRRQQEFTRLLLQKEEVERRRIATDLHDGVNHELLALKNNLLLQKAVGPEDVESVITSVREVSRNLYPALFESVGLAASVEGLCERFTKAGFFTTCALDYDGALSKEEELQVYRIVQEALNNVAKHAQAEAAKIIIRSGNSTFFLEIKDNGKGFDMSKLLNGAGSFGVQSIQQRAAAIGAALNISSTASGTVIQLTKEALK